MTLHCTALHCTVKHKHCSAARLDQIKHSQVLTSLLGPSEQELVQSEASSAGWKTHPNMVEIAGTQGKRAGDERKRVLPSA
jgi:hypothetical protein